MVSSIRVPLFLAFRTGYQSIALQILARAPLQKYICFVEQYNYRGQ